MDETQLTKQNNVSEQEFEYIELEDGQELPEGYEYEYIEVPADDVSEMDVVNRSHAFSSDFDEEVASASEIDAAIHQTQENVKEAPFPSFLKADYKENQVEVSVDTETQNVIAEQTIVEEKSAEMVDNRNQTKHDEAVKQSQNPNEDSLKQSENIVPVENVVSEENLRFLNLPENAENWHEDSRATFSLDDVKADESEITFQENDVSSSNVSDYIEPEAEYSAKDVAEFDVPENQIPRTSLLMENKNHEKASSVQISEAIDNSFQNEQSFDVLDLDEKDVSIDELLQDDTSDIELFDNQNKNEDLSSPAIDVEVVEDNEKTYLTENQQPQNIQPTLDELSEVPSSNDDFVEEIESPIEEVAEVSEITEVEPEYPEKKIDQDVNTEKTSSTNVENEIDSVDTSVNNSDYFVTETTPESIPSSKENEAAELMQKTFISSSEDIRDEKIDDEASSNEDLSYSQDQEQVIMVRSDDELEEINPLPIMFDVTDFSSENIAQAESCSRIVSKLNGIQTFKADNQISDILLSDVDFSQNELVSWNLILYQKNIFPFKKQVAELVLPQNSSLSRYVQIVQNGQGKAQFHNEENLKIINARQACVSVQGRFVCGDFDAHSCIVVDDFQPIPLADFAGKKISFSKPVSGLLAGPHGSVIFFSNVQHLWVPSSDIAEVDAQKLQYKISKWYSGSLHDKYFEFSAQSESSEFVGDEDMNAIHVNVNNSSYGWNVAFDNGISMNLRDLREYQTRLGKMPSANGVISYGRKTLKFSNVERIVVYEAAQYFFYN